MTDEPQTQETPPASFLTIVHTFGIQAMISLGEIPNPFTKEASLDAEQAKWQIDSLAILEEKTRGNLDEAEAKAMSEVLAQVRMAYVARIGQPTDEAENPADE